MKTIQQIDGDVAATTEVVGAEVMIYPITWAKLNKAIGTSAETSHRYAEGGMHFLRGQRIESEAQLWEFCALYLWCRLGRGGGRGNAFTPAAFAGFRFDEQDSVSRSQIIQHLSEVGVSADQIESFFQQTRGRLTNGI
jgi:hypothetical protein